jgi:ribosomal protein L32E
MRHVNGELEMSTKTAWRVVTKETRNEALSPSPAPVSSIILVHNVKNVIAFREHTNLATTKIAGNYGLSHNFNIYNRANKSDLFWDITPCSPLKVNVRFEGKYWFNLQG